MSISKVRLNVRITWRKVSVFKSFTSSFVVFSSTASYSSNAHQLDEHLNYCAAIVEQRDYESYLATRLLPLRKQQQVFPILALNAEVSIIRQKILRNSGVTGVYQLQFWKDTVNTLVGQMQGPVPRQPVAKALQHFQLVNDQSLPLFHKLIDARQETLGDRPFPSVEKLERNASSVHGTLIRLIAQQLATEYESDAVIEAADSLGVAAGVATLLRATIQLLKEGVVLLPADLISIHGLSPDMFFRGEFPTGLKGVAKDLCQVIGLRSEKARNKMTSIGADCRPAFLSAGLRVDHVLTCLEHEDYNILSESLQKPPNFVATRLWWRFKRRQF